ncbi:MAG: hypothetical protein GY822_22040 [Deltaproteobacteria bacterium]|nr:hypothetical protein [Deltaproteobacteria bacterium]
MFSHSWQSIEDELREKGRTDVVETITALCRAGEDQCSQKNPQGSCCLGNVHLAVKETKQKLNIVDDKSDANPDEDPSCCTPGAKPRTSFVAPHPTRARTRAAMSKFNTRCIYASYTTTNLVPSRHFSEPYSTKAAEDSSPVQEHS